jgi:prefoldin subunit 5
MAAERKPTRRLPGDETNVSRIEHENLDAEVRANGRRLERLEGKVDALRRELADISMLIRTLKSVKSI